MPEVQPLTNPKVWKALEAHYEKIDKIRLAELFAQDAKRGRANDR